MLWFNEMASTLLIPAQTIVEIEFPHNDSKLETLNSLVHSGTLKKRAVFLELGKPIEDYCFWHREEQYNDLLITAESGQRLRMSQR